VIHCIVPAPGMLNGICLC